MTTSTPTPSALRYPVLVFDWDGTLYDSTAAIVHATQAGCADLGLRIPTPDEARWIIGLGLTPALQRLQPGLGAEQTQALVERFRHHYRLQQDGLDFFPGTLDVLARLQGLGHRLAVATGANRATLQPRLNRLPPAPGPDGWFAATRTADETASKPDPMMLFELMDELDCNAAELLMIGDTRHDIDLAHNAGAQALAVSWGAHDRATLAQAQPLALVDSWDSLLHWLHPELAGEAP
ncbi:HAD family hydrolase [Amphibiibacter pelophylacis]|uniref:HAD-IA family hydrolase n=1 Tax=Amphibiibacter pelophylacis TaxID=1799477 RepID=A0ACC6P521_9BURK